MNYTAGQKNRVSNKQGKKYYLSKFFPDIHIIDIYLHFYIIFLMKTGTIKFFNAAKGFGFVKVDNSEQEIFVHVTGLIDQVREADKVSFEVVEGRKGLNAINVKKI